MQKHMASKGGASRKNMVCKGGVTKKIAFNRVQNKIRAFSLKLSAFFLKAGF